MYGSLIVHQQVYVRKYPQGPQWKTGSTCRPTGGLVSREMSVTRLGQLKRRVEGLMHESRRPRLLAHYIHIYICYIIWYIFIYRERERQGIVCRRRWQQFSTTGAIQRNLISILRRTPIYYWLQFYMYICTQCTPGAGSGRTHMSKR